MNVYALFPLVAVIAYIPLLITTIGSRPWRQRQGLFILYLSAATIWSLTDVFLRSNLYPDWNFFLLKVIIITYTLTAVQFHLFTSSFFPPGQGRWLWFAYFSLALVIFLVVIGYMPEGVTSLQGNKLYLDYGKGIIFVAVPLLVLLARNLYVFFRMFRTLENPVLYNQIVSLILAIMVLAVSSLAAILPWGREFAVTHFGNIINAFILSYATIRHQLVDVRLVLRRSLAWFILVVIGISVYWLLLGILHLLFHFQIDPKAMFIATMLAILIALLLQRLRSFLFITMGKAFQGQSFDYRQKLSDFADNIHTVFSVKEQGAELLSLITRAVNCKGAGLLFREADSDDFITQVAEPRGTSNPLSGLRLSGHSPILAFLRRERKSLTRETLAILPEFRGLWQKEKEEIKTQEIELFVPLISRQQLIGILVLEKKRHGRYLLEDLRLLEEVASRVAVSMEKEYLREQMREREREMAIINRASLIITANLDIQNNFGSFIKELRQLIEIHWAAIMLIEEDELFFLAVFSEQGSPWQAGERISINGTASQRIIAQRKAIIQPDLAKESRFVSGIALLQRGMRSVIYLPLIANDRVIGTLAFASNNPYAYQHSHSNLLQNLSSQISMPIANSRRYAQVELKARLDALTGLLNRSSMDELIASEIQRHSRYGGMFSLIIFDLDKFKEFNDKNGHLAGDRLLKQIGRTLKSTIRSADYAFRYGGDEFAILLPQTPADASRDVAERIRQKIPLELSASNYTSVTASFGVASWPAHGVIPDEVIAAADAALYQAKRSGGNQCRLYSASAQDPDSNTHNPAPNNGNGEALNAIYALAATVDSRDHYTKSHSKKVSDYAIALGEALKLDQQELDRLNHCALLHDIGKIGISDGILNKASELKPEEWEIIKTHPKLGATIAGRISELSAYVRGILYHHERYDGTGYPEGLKGEEIPLEARILAIADAFAAMTSDRVHSKALSLEASLEELRSGSGTQFDPHLVETFLNLVAKKGIVAEPKSEVR